MNTNIVFTDSTVDESPLTSVPQKPKRNPAPVNSALPITEYALDVFAEPSGAYYSKSFILPPPNHGEFVKMLTDADHKKLRALLFYVLTEFAAQHGYAFWTQVDVLKSFAVLIKHKKSTKVAALFPRASRDAGERSNSHNYEIIHELMVFMRFKGPTRVNGEDEKYIVDGIEFYYAFYDVFARHFLESAEIWASTPFGACTAKLGMEAYFMAKIEAAQARAIEMRPRLK